MCIKMAKKKKQHHKKSVKKQKKEIKESKVILPVLSQQKHSHKSFYIAFSVIAALIITFTLILYIPEEEIKLVKTQENKTVENQTTTELVIEPIISTIDIDEKPITDEISRCVKDFKDLINKTIENYNAMNSNDINTCSTLSDDEKAFCEARINKDVDFCNDVLDKDVCKAVILNDPLLCKSNQNCVSLLTKDVSFCNSFELKESLLCKFQITGDKKHYDLAIQEFSKDCIDQAYNKFAFLYNEPNLCLRILNKELKKTCQSTTSIDS